jgi:hypothetical protein
LEGGPPCFPRPFTGAAVLGNLPQGDLWPFAYGAFTLCGAAFQRTSARPRFCNSPRGRRTPPGRSRNPAVAKAAAMAPPRFGLSPFRSPLLGASRLISFPRATKRFCFARCPLPPKGGMPGYKARRVSPFGHPRVIGCLRLTGAYRSLPRPSSAPAAEASTPDPY